MFRKKHRSGSRPAAPGPCEVPEADSRPLAPSDPVAPGTTPSALKDIVAPRRPRADGPPAAPGHIMVVGRDIVLIGEIEACETLIIEGRVEGEIADTRYLEIAESGRFKGSAAVEECVVAGACEGDITVAGLLAVHAKGRIKGKV